MAASGFASCNARTFQLRYDLVERKRPLVMGPDIPRWMFNHMRGDTEISNDRDPRCLVNLADIVAPEIVFYPTASGLRKSIQLDNEIVHVSDQVRARVFEETGKLLPDSVTITTKNAPEAFLNLSNYDSMDTDPLPPSHPRLSQFDRQIFESCADPAGGKIMMPHSVRSVFPARLSISNITFKAKCTEKDARALGDLFNVLDFTAAMVNTYCRKVQDGNVKPVLDELYPLALAVEEVENPIVEDEPWIHSPALAGKPMSGSYIDNLRGYNGICKDSLAYTNPDFDLDWVNPTGQWINGECSFKHDSGIHVLEDLGQQDKQTWEEKPSEAPTIGYHILEDFTIDPDAEVIDWVDTQSRLFKNLLQHVIRCSPDKIAEAGIYLHKLQEKLSAPQAGVVWTSFNSRKRELMTPFGRRILKRVQTTKRNPGSKLHAMRTGESPTPVPLTKIDWSVIWSEHKKKFKAPAKKARRA